MGRGWISDYKSREIHGNNYRRTDSKEKQTIPSEERRHAGLARGRNGGLGGDARQLGRGSRQGAPHDMGRLHVAVPWGLG